MQVPLPPLAWPRKVEPWGATNYLADSGAVIVSQSQEPVMFVSGTGRKKVNKIKGPCTYDVCTEGEGVSQNRTTVSKIVLIYSTVSGACSF